MKLLLAVPTIEEREYLGESRSLRLVSNYIPSLGAGYLAAVARKQDVDVRIHNPVIPGPVEQIADLVAQWRPDILGLSVFTPHARSVTRLFGLMRERSLRPLTIIGGPHVSALPEASMRHWPADIGVVGEGEATLLEILSRYRDGCRELHDIPGTVFRAAGEIKTASPRVPIDPLDRLPFPARDLLPPLSEYRPTPASVRRMPLAVLMTSRGCPYRCTFCDRSVFGNLYRTHSPEYVISEMEEVIGSHGAREIRFFDDDLAVDRKRAMRLAGLIMDRGLRIPWTCNMSARSADAELLKTFRAAGCWQVLYGLESGSERILRRLKKHVTPEVSAGAVRIALEAGLRVRADFLVGSPGETMDEMWSSVKLAIKLNVDMAHFNKFVPFPGTEIHNDLARAGLTFDYEQNWSDSDNSNLVYVPEGIDPGEYREFLDRSYRAFYLRPRYILRRLSRIRTWTEFKGHVRGVLTMLFL